MQEIAICDRPHHVAQPWKKGLVIREGNTVGLSEHPARAAIETPQAWPLSRDMNPQREKPDPMLIGNTT